MDKPRQKLQGPVKLLIIFVTFLLLSAGLCGIQITLLNDTSIHLGSTLPGIMIILGYTEVFVILVCIVGIATTLAYWAFSTIFRRRN